MSFSEIRFLKSWRQFEVYLSSNKITPKNWEGNLTRNEAANVLGRGFGKPEEQMGSWKLFFHETCIVPFADQLCDICRQRKRLQVTRVQIH